MLKWLFKEAKVLAVSIVQVLEGEAEAWVPARILPLIFHKSPKLPGP